MKKTLVLVALMASAVGAFAQGTVNFNNLVTGIVRAPVYGPELSDPTISRTGNTSAGTPAGVQTYTGATLSGAGFTAQLWGAAGANTPVASLAPLVNATTSFRTGTAAGFINATLFPGGNALMQVPNTPIDGTGYQGTFQLRAWDNVGGTITSWAMVMANDSILRGASPAFTPTAVLGGTGTPPQTPPNLTGLVSFNLFTPVPEPSLIALGALGLGALLLRRRK